MQDRYDAVDYVKRDYSTLAKLGLAHEMWSTLWGKPVYTRIAGSVTGGNLHFPSAEEREEDDSRDTDGWFWYGNVEFLTNIALTNKWSFAVSGSGQKAFGKNLDSSEQFIVTGLRGVKAYRETVSGDNGFLLNSELKYKLPSILKWEHALGGFVDYGGWSYEKRPFPDPHLGDMTFRESRAITPQPPKVVPIRSDMLRRRACSHRWPNARLRVLQRETMLASNVPSFSWIAASVVLSATADDCRKLSLKAVNCCWVRASSSCRSCSALARMRCCVVPDADQSFRVAASSSVNSSLLAGAPIPVLLGRDI